MCAGELCMLVGFFREGLFAIRGAEGLRVCSYLHYFGHIFLFRMDHHFFKVRNIMPTSLSPESHAVCLMCYDLTLSISTHPCNLCATNLLVLVHHRVLHL